MVNRAGVLVFEEPGARDDAIALLESAIGSLR